MQIVFLVNDPTDIQPTQTTAMLINAAVNQGHSVGVTGVSDLACHNDGQPWAQVRWLKEKTTNLQRFTQQISTTRSASACLAETEILMIRTNPSRSDRAASHGFALDFARICQQNGIRVINQPEGLVRAASKLYLLELPVFTRPSTLVSQNRAEILSFISALKTSAVLKPIKGTRGNDVFLIDGIHDSNLNQIIDVILRQGPVMAQRCIPGAAAGDTRVVVFNGKVLEVNGHFAAIQRVPKRGDFRSNIHAGGVAKLGTVTDEMRQVVEAVSPKLVQEGLFLVGLDFIGTQLVEINVFSTGGLRDAERFTGQAFADTLIEKIVMLCQL